MIGSIGYESLEPAEFDHLARRWDLVIDVRSRPSGHVKRGFARADLESRLGDRYAWHGDRLGGYSKITAAALNELARLAQTRSVLIFCQEEAPGDCHRHESIAVPLIKRGLLVRHLCDGEVVLADELQRAIESDDDYECLDESEWLSPSVGSVSGMSSPNVSPLTY